MNKKMDIEAEAFERDLDRLAHGAQPSEQGDPDYHANLALADLLRRAHFVPTSGFERRLSRQLDTQVNASNYRRRIVSVRLSRPILRTLAAAAIAAVIVLAVVLSMAPDAGAQGGSQLVARFVQVASPWLPLQKVRNVPPPPDVTGGRPALPPPAPGSPTEEPELTAPTEEPELTAPTSAPFSIPTPPPISGPTPVLPAAPSSPMLISLDQAQAQASFRIRSVTWLPHGYTFKGVAPRPSQPDLKGLPPVPSGLPPNPVQPKSAPPDRNPPPAPPFAPAVPNRSLAVILVFGNSAGESFLLTEKAIGNIPAPGTVELPAGKGSVQDVTINGQPGQYVEGSWTPQGWVATGNHLLHWQSVDGILFDINSPTLNRDTLLHIAESIK